MYRGRISILLLTAARERAFGLERLQFISKTLFKTTAWITLCAFSTHYYWKIFTISTMSSTLSPSLTTRSSPPIYSRVPWFYHLRTNAGEHPRTSCTTEDVPLHPDYILTIPSISENCRIDKILAQSWLHFTLNTHIGIESDSCAFHLANTFRGDIQDLYRRTEIQWIEFFLKAPLKMGVDANRAKEFGSHLHSLLDWIKRNKGTEAGLVKRQPSQTCAASNVEDFCWTLVFAVLIWLILSL